MTKSTQGFHVKWQNYNCAKFTGQFKRFTVAIYIKNRYRFIQYQ